MACGAVLASSPSLTHLESMAAATSRTLTSKPTVDRGSAPMAWPQHPIVASHRRLKLWPRRQSSGAKSVRGSAWSGGDVALGRCQPRPVSGWDLGGRERGGKTALLPVRDGRPLAALGAGAYCLAFAIRRSERHAEASKARTMAMEFPGSCHRRHIGASRPAIAPRQLDSHRC